MSTPPYILESQVDPPKRSLRTPVVILAVLVIAFLVSSRWLRSMTGGQGFLYHQTSSGWQKLPLPTGYPESLRISNGGTVWLLTWGKTALNRWDGTRWHSYPNTDFGIDTHVLQRELAVDGEDVWMASEQGVLHWDGRRWQLDRTVTVGYGARTVAGGGEVWAIDSTGKLLHFAKGKWQSEQVTLPGMTWEIKKHLPTPRIARTDDGTFWLMREGLWRRDGSTWTRVTDNGDRLEDAQLLGAAGMRVWLRDSEKIRSLTADGKHWTAYTNEQTGLGEPDWVDKIASRGGKTWFGTSKGSLEFDGVNWRKLSGPEAQTLEIRHLAGAPDGTLWIIGWQHPNIGPLRSMRYVILAVALIPVAILVVFGWIVVRYRKRELQKHQRVTQAVQHATGEVPPELEAGQKTLHSRGLLGTAFIWLGTIVSYVLMRMVWPKAPYWIIPLIGITMHLLLTLRGSLVKRKPKPSDPIGPGGPSRYDWGKSWQAVAGAAALILLLNLDRFPALRFLRGYWLWIFVLGPTLYHTASVLFLNRSTKRSDYDTSLKIIRWTYFYNPSGMEPLRMLGHTLLLAGRYQEAEDTLRRSLASSQATRSYGYALEYLGDALMEQGRYEEAMRSYEAAIHAVPWLHRAYRGMAETVLRRELNPAQALEYIEKILDFANVSWAQQKGNGKAQDDYWGLKAWAMARLGRTSEVAEAIDQALKHTDRMAAPDMASTHYRAGMAMQALGRESEAREHFKLAIQFDPHGRRGMLATAAMRETGVWGSAKVPV